MNPSVGQILEAVTQPSTPTMSIVLPNNPNVHLAADAARGVHQGRAR